MQNNFVKELRWRGMLQDIVPDTEEYLIKNPSTGYIGFDPTADSLHIGNLVQIMILIHFSKCRSSANCINWWSYRMTLGDPLENLMKGA